MTGTPPASGAPVQEAMGPLLSPERLGSWTWALGYTALLSTLAMLRYRLLLATGFDLGLYEQGLWLLLHRGLAAATSYTGAPILARDASWLLLPLAPLYAVGGTGLLLVLQSAALGSGYLLLRRIARACGAPPGRAHLVAALYLLYPALLGANLFDFHPEALLVPELLGALAAALEGRRGAFVLLCILALATSDQAALPLLVLGPVLLLSGRPFEGAVSALVAAGGAFLDGHVLLPAAAGVALSARALLGAGLWHAARSGALLQALHVRRVWEYGAVLLGPLVLPVVAGRPRRLGLWALPGLAVVAANVAAGTAAATSPFDPTTLAAVPFLFMACAASQSGVAAPGTSGQAAPGEPPAAGPPRPHVLSVLATVAALCAALGAVGHEALLAKAALPRNATSVRAALALVPPGAPVLAQNFVLPQVSNRARAIPTDRTAGTLRAGTLVLLDTSPGPDPVPAALTAALGQGGPAPRPKVLYDQGGVILEELRQPLTLPPAGPSH